MQGVRIREIRKELNMSQTEFASRLGVSGGAISLLEKGDRNLTDQMLKAICREFSINPDWLTKGIGPMYKPQSDSDIEIITRAMEGENENKKQLIRIMADMPDELLDKMMEYLESRLRK